MTISTMKSIENKTRGIVLVQAYDVPDSWLQIPQCHLFLLESPGGKNQHFPIREACCETTRL